MRNDENTLSVSETTKNESLFILAKPLRGVSETTKPRQVYMKRRNTADRIRKDDGQNAISLPFDEVSVPTDTIDSVEIPSLSLTENMKTKKPTKAYAKRRISTERIRNDETIEGVCETTKVTEAYPKQRMTPERMRNDEVRTVKEVRLKPGKAPLLPERYPNEDLFICDVLDAIPKDDMASMEHPMFTLATRPDMRTVHYEHNGNTVSILPSAVGLATIHDKDILIYCVSQLIAKINREEPVGRTVYLKAYDLLSWSNRQISGDGYQRLIAALDRLAGTRIKTNIKAGDEVITESFGLINEYRVVRNVETGVMSEIKITLSDWLFKMVQGKSVLTLHRDYFRLRKPLERRIYEIARKHCGSQPRFKLSIDILHKKSGSAGNIRLFRQTLRELEASNHLPDYVIELVNDGVVFHHRDHLPKLGAAKAKVPYVDPEGMHDAKQVAPGYDVYALYQEWGDWWIASGCPELKSANAAFVGFCRHKNQQKPLR